jgi:hypothetical protein
VTHEFDVDLPEPFGPTTDATVRARPRPRRQHGQQRRLTGAVGTDEAGQGAAPHFDGDPGDGVCATEIAGHVPHEAPRPHPMQQKKVPNG